MRGSNRHAVRLLDLERAPSMLQALKKHCRRFAFMTTEKCSYGSTSLPLPHVRMSDLPLTIAGNSTANSSPRNVAT